MPLSVDAARPGTAPGFGSDDPYVADLVARAMWSVRDFGGDHLPPIPTDGEVPDTTERYIRALVSGVRVRAREGASVAETVIDLRNLTDVGDTAADRLGPVLYMASRHVSAHRDKPLPPWMVTVALQVAHGIPGPHVDVDGDDIVMRDTGGQVRRMRNDRVGIIHVVHGTATWVEVHPHLGPPSYTDDVGPTLRQELAAAAPLRIRPATPVGGPTVA